MLDKDKLFLIVEVGIGSLRNNQIYEQIEEIENYFYEALDESVKIIILPRRDMDYIQLKQLNTEKVTIEELNEIVSKAEDIIKKIEIENGK